MPGDFILANMELPRKKRTREHIIASQSINHVEYYIYNVGFTAERVENDYGYDLILFTYNSEGYVEQGNVYIQLKASDRLISNPPNNEYKYRISIEDYNQWINEPLPVFMVLYDAKNSKAFWQYVQSYFELNGKQKPRRNAKSVQIRIPTRNRINKRAIYIMQKSKNRVLDQIDGIIEHV